MSTARSRVDEMVVARACALRQWATGTTAAKGWRRLNPSPILKVDSKGVHLTLADIGAGLRGVPGSICIPSTVGREGAMLYRRPIQLYREHTADEIFPLLVTGQLVTQEAALEFRLACREVSELQAAQKAVEVVPNGLGPMETLAQAIMNMDCLSQMYRKKQYGWEEAWIDAKVLMGAVSQVVGWVYNKCSKQSVLAPPSKKLGLAASLLEQLGTAPKDLSGALKFLDVYNTQLCSHSVNLSRRAAEEAGSGGANIFQAVAIGIQFLNLPKHGGAQAQIPALIGKVKTDLSLNRGELPTEEQLLEWCVSFLSDGGSIDGIGHAVIKDCIDPRAEVFRNLGRSRPEIAEDWDFRLLDYLSEAFPRVLGNKRVQEVKAISMRFPNVDFFAGPMQGYVLGIEDPRFYALLFAWSRLQDYITAVLHSMMMGLPIIRMESLDFDAVNELCWSQRREKEGS